MVDGRSSAVDEKDNSKFLQSCSEVYEWFKDVLRESDNNRALVLMGGTRLDLELEEAIKAKLAWNPEGQDNLFGPDRAIGSFSAKISLAHRLGIISDEFHSSVQIVRRIRNDFAHSTAHMRLKEVPHKDRVAELERLNTQHPLWEMGMSMMKEARLTDEATHFGAAIIVMTITLLAFRHSEPRFQVVRPCALKNVPS
jgi:hypothetical protein